MISTHVRHRNTGPCKSMSLLFCFSVSWTIRVIGQVISGGNISPHSMQSHDIHHAPLVRNAGAVILKIAYGYDVKGEHDHFLGLAREGIRVGSLAGAPGKWLVDSFPICTLRPHLNIVSLTPAMQCASYLAAFLVLGSNARLLSGVVNYTNNHWSPMST